MYSSITQLKINSMHVIVALQCCLLQKSFVLSFIQRNVLSLLSGIGYIISVILCGLLLHDSNLRNAFLPFTCFYWLYYFRNFQWFLLLV